MSETTHRDWQRWRIAPVAGAKRAQGAKVARPFERMTARAPAAPATDAAAPAPAVEGIRQELVARVRAEIAAGTYDTEEKWALAEEALMRRIEGTA